MHERTNRQVRLKSRPPGIPEAEHFEIVEALAWRLWERSPRPLSDKALYVDYAPPSRSWCGRMR
jgi:hypothetical protein